MNNELQKLIMQSKKMTLLYVDDNHDTRALMLSVLEKFFDNIIVAEDADDALNKFETNNIDLLIIDIDMPKLDGLLMVKQIKIINDCLPVVALSSYKKPELFINCIKSGVDGYLVKPFSIKQFIALLNKLVQFKAVKHNINTTNLTAVETEQQLLSAKKQLDKANYSKSAFLANMTHELRTPINTIMGMCFLALEGNLDNQQKYYIETAQQSAQSLMDVVDDILDFSKLNAAQLTMEKIDFNLNNVMFRMASVISQKAEEKKITIKKNIAINVPDNLIGDPLRLEQILIELGKNAIQFSNMDSEIEFNISIKEEHENSVLLLFSIAGEGLKISSEQEKNLLQSYSQADRSISNEFASTSLGLTIVKQLIEMMQGKMWFDTKPYGGTVFYFTLRLACQSAKLSREDSMCREEKDDSIRILNGARILLVEDNFVNQEITLELLRQNGVQTELADNGFEALEMLKQYDFDGILMDCQMPIMDGYTATQKIREQLKFKDLPIIAMTADTMSGDRDKALSSGMNDYIPKPVNVNSMFAIMAKWIKPNSRSQMDSVATPVLPEELQFTDLTGIDTVVGLELTEHNSKLYCTLLVIFQSSQNNFSNQFKRANQVNDFKQMHYLAHSLKGAAGSIGANVLQEMALKLELACQLKEELNEIMLSTIIALDIVLLGIKKFKKSNKNILYKFSHD